MPHTSQWLVDKRVIHVQHEGDVDQAELLDINATLSAYLEDGIAPIYFISDNSKTSKINLSVKSVKASFTVLNDKRWGTMYVIGASTLIKFFANIVSQSFRLNIKMVNTVDEAQELIAKTDDTLSHL